MFKPTFRKGIARTALLIVAVGIIALVAVALVVSGVINIGFFGGDTLDRGSVETVKYENTDYSISLYRPKDWEVKGGDGEDAFVSFVAPLEFDGDEFRENVLVSVTDVSQFEGIEVAHVMDAWIQDTGEDAAFTNFEVITRNFATLDGYEAEFAVYSAEKDGIEVKGSAAVVLVGTNAYVFTYTAAAESYDTFFNDSIGILDTAQITF